MSENKTSTGSDEDEDEMLTEALQFSQLSVEEFCMIVLSQVIPMCQGALSTNLTTIETAVNLLHEVLSLLKKVLPVNLWQSGTQLNSLMVRCDASQTKTKANNEHNIRDRLLISIGFDN